MNYFCVNLHNIKIKLYICREERNKVLKTKKKKTWKQETKN
jgi:hypothetical protein